jgi:diguanylate cyclase (GGDEF)-like protein/PAS domain S-box-containing protein
MAQKVIVCIDDERLILVSLRTQLLRSLDYDCVIEVAESGQEALALFAELAEVGVMVAVAICDQNIPDIPGDQLLGQLHSLSPMTRNILLTGQLNLNAVVNAVNAANLYRFIPKPWDEADLTLTVREALRSYEQEHQLTEQNEALRTVNQQLQQEILERHHAQVLLQKSEERLDSILFSLDEVVWSAQIEPFKLVYINPAVERVYGRPIHEFLENSNLRREVIHPEDLPYVQQSQAILQVEGSLELEYRILHPDGQVRWVSDRTQIVYGSAEQPNRLDGIVSDITQRKLAQAQLIHDALHDALTGLPNRILLMERLDQAVRNSRRHRNHQFAVLFIDLDRFKVINDSLGHSVGDQLLIVIAEILQQAMRQTDTVARLGGDEFAILLDQINDCAEATEVADRVLASLATPLQIENHCVFIGASVGIAFSASTYENGAALLRDADIAMYRAKSAGKACSVIFDEKMYAQTRRLLELEQDLHSALARQEFCLHYQPIILLESGQLLGFEALIRWNHPTLGFVSPADFIPVAETIGLIVPIGTWVLEEACHQLRQWQDQFPATATLKVSVNLASRQLQEPDLLQQLDRILAKTGLSSQCLHLEITESMLMSHTDTVVETLQAIRDRNIKLNLDDFGTGYSSLSYIHRFPLDTLKIDQSFVSRMASENEDFEIVRTIISLAHILGMTVVAEGIEQPEQARQLIQLGCDQGQGHLFSTPLEPEKIVPLLATEPLWLSQLSSIWQSNLNLTLSATP